MQETLVFPLTCGKCSFSSASPQGFWHGTAFLSRHCFWTHDFPILMGHFKFSFSVSSWWVLFDGGFVQCLAWFFLNAFHILLKWQKEDSPLTLWSSGDSAASQTCKPARNSGRVAQRGLCWSSPEKITCGPKEDSCVSVPGLILMFRVAWPLCHRHLYVWEENSDKIFSTDLFWQHQNQWKSVVCFCLWNPPAERLQAWRQNLGNKELLGEFRLWPLPSQVGTIFFGCCLRWFEMM